MDSTGNSTAERILDAAERLFATDGIDATTLSSILSTAEARNKSAITYHFGTKFDLLLAVIDRRRSEIDAHRNRLLDEIEEQDPPDLHALVGAMIEPVAALLESPAGACYVQIQAALLSYPRRELLPDALRDPTSRLTRLQRLMALTPRPPDPSPEVTRDLLVSLIFHGFADFSRSAPTPAECRRFAAEMQLAVHAILVRHVGTA